MCAAVSYEEAKRWLKKIGGEMIEGKEQMRGSGSIVVSVKSARGRPQGARRLCADRRNRAVASETTSPTASRISSRCAVE